MKRNVITKLLAIALIVPTMLITSCGGSEQAGTAPASSAASGSASASAAASESAAPAATGGDGPEVTWKMGSTWGSGNIHFLADQRFAELVGQFTGGKFVIQNYAEGELCAANQLIDYVQDGTIEAGGDWGGYWAGRDTTFEILSTLIDDFDSTDYFNWFYEGGGLDCYNYIYNQYNIQYFPIALTGTESGIRSTKAIESLDDMKGMKIRLGGVLAGKVGQELGINITTVAAAELYESLQRGVIDAGEFSGPWADDSLKLQEVCPYWCAPAWYQSAGVNGVMINMDAWNALPAEYQEAVAMAAELTVAESFHKYHWNNAATTNKMLQEQGVTITKMNDKDYQTIRDTALKVYEAEAAANENFKYVWDSMEAYRNTMNVYRDWLGDYSFGYNRPDADLSGAAGSTETHVYSE